MIRTMLAASWAIVARPSVVMFQDHERNRFGWALIYVTLGATISAILGWLAFLIQRPFLERQYAMLAVEFGQVEAEVGHDLPFDLIFDPVSLGTPVISNVLGTLVGFLTYLLIIFLVGRALGGRGTLGELAYDIALFWVPVSVVSAAINVFSIGVLACLTAPLAIGVTGYGLYLTYLSVQAGMKLLPHRALILVLIPAGLWLLVAGGLVLMVAAIAA